MRKLLLIIIALFIASPCFARTDVLSNQGTYFKTNNVLVGTTAVALGTTNPVIEVLLKPDINNSAVSIISIGDSNVANTRGFQLASGTVLRLNLQDITGLYAVSNVTGQKLNVGYTY